MTAKQEPNKPLQPILVMMSYRGGERLQRCLDSIGRSERHFKRIILSVTAAEDSEDMRIAAAFQQQHPTTEVICTQQELPTMQHQAFWVTYLKKSGATKDDWIYWLAYDDQVRLTGIDELVDEPGNWPLEKGTCYFGPWAMRHEQAEQLWDGDSTADLESWTSFPLAGPLRLPVITWIAEQLKQPTYMQMSGSVCRFESYLRIRDGRPKKKGPMRIEMATAATPCNEFVAEFATPVSIIYGRPNSDRANYAKSAREEDVHLVRWLIQYTLSRPASTSSLIRSWASASSALWRVATGGRPNAVESWVTRTRVRP
ncbi:MAG: hypothetical protein NTX29_03580 [Actinobacteria bacterium]|nr:hypothetical protein [Actinomycetota bacterium]